jgi:hypothetical protein
MSRRDRRKSVVMSDWTIRELAGWLFDLDERIRRIEGFLVLDEGISVMDNETMLKLKQVYQDEINGKGSCGRLEIVNPEQRDIILHKGDDWARLRASVADPVAYVDELRGRTEVDCDGQT